MCVFKITPALTKTENVVRNQMKTVRKTLRFNQLHLQEIRTILMLLSASEVAIYIMSPPPHVLHGSAMSNVWSFYSWHLDAPECHHNNPCCVHKMKSNVALSKILQIESSGSKYALNTDHFWNTEWDYHFNIAVKLV